MFILCSVVGCNNLSLFGAKLCRDHSLTTVVNDDAPTLMVDEQVIPTSVFDDFSINFNRYAILEVDMTINEYRQLLGLLAPQPLLWQDEGDQA